ncbi:MAG TPA: hypothetical protein VFV96_14600 [Verrucomicrobiae bacterium]|nr:hypothetical protein [Verrucomicrobiae bacterium]
MNNSGILKRRSSLTFKVQVALSVSMFAVMSIFAILDALVAPSSHSGLVDWISYLYLRLLEPTIILIQAFGMDDGVSYLGHKLFAILLNPLLVFCIIGVIGNAITFIKKKTEG